MSITYGFYNSQNGDRKYDAESMGRIFDGIIQDGVYQSINDGKHIGFQVYPATPVSMNVLIASGRAWFDHTWTLNDTSDTYVTIPAAEVATDRWDAVVLEVNSGSRTNSLKVISGTPGSSPTKPTATNNSTVHQHILAYVYVKANATTITSSNITNNVGVKGNGCAFVTQAMEAADISTLFNAWEEQWSAWSGAEQGAIQTEFSKWKTEWEDYYNSITSDMDTSKSNYDAQWNSWYTNYTNAYTSEMANWRTNEKTAFDEWFAGLQYTLDGDVAGKLKLAIEKLESRATALESFDNMLTGTHSITQDIYDTLDNSTKLEDSNGNVIESQLIFVVK